MKEEEQIEADIKEKGLNAPRLSPGDIDEVVVSEEFILMPSGKAMVCELTLRNGFTVRGESACVSRENFDYDIGRKISYANARNKVWELEGYLLQEFLHSSRKIDASVARICHEVNRAYCEALGDTSQVSWEDAPQWQRDSAELGVALHINHPEAGPEASHASWMRQKIDDGWVYGPVKDADKKEHPCMVPFDQLPVEQQAKDYIFKAIVNGLSPREGE